MPGGQAPEELDQPAWQRLTTWDGGPPRLDEVWALLSSPDLPGKFQTTLRESRHTFIQQLRRAMPGGPAAGGPIATVEPRKEWNNRFANLVSGRFTEILFSMAYRPLIESRRLTLVETVERRDWGDYLIRGDDGQFQLAVNTKNAGVQFRGAEQFVGLPPEDTLPIATYKIFGSSVTEEQLPLVYVYLVDWTLIPRLRPAYWQSLNSVERRLFRLGTTFKGMPRDLEDCFIEATVADRMERLAMGVGYDVNALAELPFRAISGARCKAIFYREHGRSPYVFLQRMNTDPNVHVSVRSETMQFGDFVDTWLSTPETRAELLVGLRRTTTMAIPDPPM